MINLDEANRFNKTIQIAQSYNQALSNLKERYYEIFIQLDISSPQEDQALNAVFVLDFMIQRNAYIMKYLSCLQKHNQEISAINAWLNINFSETNINTLIHHMMDKIEADGAQITKTIIAQYHSNNTDFANSVLRLFCTGILLSALGIGLIFGFQIAWANLLGWACFTVGASLIAFLRPFSDIVGRYMGKSQIPKESIEELVRLTQIPIIELYKHANDGNEPDPITLSTMLEFKSYYSKDFRPSDISDKSAHENIKTTRTLNFYKNASKTTLVNRFFDQRVSAQSAKISEDIQQEYARITALAL
ncbi:MAG: hypothetical protein ACO1N3_00690 [Gammaproteobacteria bacterium]